MKRILSAILVVALMLGLSVCVFGEYSYGAKEVTVNVNGETYKLLGYEVPGGDVGVKVRDIAYLFNGTSKQFNVYFQEGYVHVVTGQPYAPIGIELQQYTGTEVKGAYSHHIFMLDGNYSGVEATLAADYNYVPLAYFSALLGAMPIFNEDGSIKIDTDYVLDDSDWG